MVTKQKKFNSLYICFDSFDKLKSGYVDIVEEEKETTWCKYCIEVRTELKKEELKTERFLIEVND